MSDTVVSISNLSKRYRLGEISTGTLSHDLNEWLNASKADRQGKQELWALNDINLEIHKGEILGVIGKNGAGKSTLLKILSRITAPSKGSVKMKGKVSSLLEVGTGMHPEMTARENIYLNGAILGMKKADIAKRFDDIVSFSGCQQFVDTPIKRFSSGMKVRLGFAVAAYLDADILIIDEILAVGDASFQKKCIGKITEIANTGKTILFVSHNMASIQSFCSRVLVMNNGAGIFLGDTDKAIELYFQLCTEQIDRFPLHERSDRDGNGEVRCQKIDFVNQSGMATVSSGISGQPLEIIVHYNATIDLENVVFAIGFFNATGVFLTALRTDATGELIQIQKGQGSISFRIDKLPFSGGRYFINVNCQRLGEIIDSVKDAAYLDVETGDYYGTGRVPASAYQGVFVDYQWNHKDLC